MNVKTHLIYLLVIAGCVIAILFMWKGCGKVTPTQPTIKIDTVYIAQKKDTVYQPKLDTLLLPSTILPAKLIFDTLYLEAYRPIDTLAILKDYYAKAVYSDTQHIQYGNVIIKDTVTQNRILSRHLITDLQIPEITKTITLSPPKRNQLYFGVSYMQQTDFKNAAIGAELMFLNKNNLGIEAGYYYSNQTQRFYKIGIKKLITFKKQ